VQTNKRHFQIYKKECEKWVQRLGLQRYRITYRHEEIEERIYGYCQANIEAGCAAIGLNKEWEDEDVTDYMLRQTAFHEVVELLFQRFYQLAESRYATESEIETERHTIIRSLESAFFK